MAFDPTRSLSIVKQILDSGLIAVSIKAKFHYAIQVTNEVCELDSVMQLEYGLYLSGNSNRLMV